MNRKVLHILDHSLPIYDGYTFRSSNIFRAQRGVGLEPMVVTSPKHEADWAGPWRSSEMLEQVLYLRSGAVPSRGLPVLDEWRLMRRLHRWVRRIARVHRPAILHAHSPVLNALPALWAGRELGIPVVYEIRAFWEDAGADQGSYTEGGAKYRLVRALETFACRRADRVVPICEGLAQDLRRRGLPAEKLRIVPNAVDPDQFTESEPDEALADAWGLRGKLVVGFIGSFYHFEGLDLLLRAAASLKNRFPQLVVLLVGGGEMAERLQQLVRELKLEETVLLPGRVAHDRIAGVYGLIDVLAYPRKPMRLTELVTPLKPLEAMAMGKALLASDVGGHRELIRDGRTGLLFRAGEESSLAERLAHLLEDAEMRQRLGREGRTWVREERRWSRNGERYLDLYREILGERTEEGQAEGECR